MTELQEKISKLPTWAREHIRRLENLPGLQTEELARQRKQIDRLEKINREQKDRIEAMIEMFQCAAKGGNEVAAAVQRIVEDWLTTDEPGEENPK